MRKVTHKKLMSDYPLLVALRNSRDMGNEGYKIDTLIRRNNIESIVEGYEKKRHDTIVELGEDVMVPEMDDKGSPVLDDQGKPKQNPSGGKQITDPEKLKEFNKIMEECGAEVIELPVPCATLERIEKAKVTLSMDGRMVINNECLSGQEIGRLEWLFLPEEKRNS